MKEQYNEKAEKIQFFLNIIFVLALIWSGIFIFAYGSTFSQWMFVAVTFSYGVLAFVQIIWHDLW